jgi:hypothetical protein
LCALHAYVGVSSGAFVAAGLANGLDTAEMCRIFVTGESTQATFRPETFLRPARYAERYRHADLVLIEPNADDAEMFFTNVFSYAHRKRLAEDAYQTTRADLVERRDEIGVLLARHGLALRDEVLDDARRTLAGSLRPAKGRTDTTSNLGGALDELGKMLRPRKKAAGRR